MKSTSLMNDDDIVMMIKNQSNSKFIQPKRMNHTREKELPRLVKFMNLLSKDWRLKKKL